MGVELEIPPEEEDLMVSVKKKIRVPLDEKYANFPMQSVYEYLRRHVLTEIVELEGVLIEFKDVRIKSIGGNSPSDTHANVKGTFTILKIEPGRRLQAKFLSSENGVLICSGSGLAVHIKDKHNIGQLIAAGAQIQYKFCRFANENGFLILHGKKPKLFGLECSSMDTGGETQTEDEVASPKKRKKEDGESSPNKRMKPEVNGEVPGASKKTPQIKSAGKKDEIPEGYKKEEYFSATNPKRKYVKITAPDGKTFSIMKKAREYFEKTKSDNQADVTMANDDANNTTTAAKKGSAKEATKDVTTKLNFESIASDDDFKPEQNNSNKKTPAKKNKDKSQLAAEPKEIKTPVVKVKSDETPAKKKKGANTPGRNVIPEGYTDLSTPSAANPNKKNIKIQAPDGKKFSTIKAAQEYHAKSLEKKDENEEDVEELEELEKRMDENEAKTEDSDVKMEEESDDDDEPVADKSMVVEKKTSKKAPKTPSRYEIPEGYKDLSTPSEKGKKKRFNIQAPDGKMLKSIKAAKEHYARSLEERNVSDQETEQQEESDIEKDEKETEEEESDREKAEKETEQEESDREEDENETERDKETESDDEQDADNSMVDEENTPDKKVAKKMTKSKKGANTPGRNEIPKGYTDLSTPSAANPKKKNIKIQAPDGKKFSTIKAAQEYFAKSRESAKSELEKDENEVTTDEEEKDDSDHKSKTVEITPLESDDDSDSDESVIDAKGTEESTEKQTEQDEEQTSKAIKSDKKKTGFKLGQIPEGYTDLSTKPEEGGKRRIKIQAPDGKTFSSILKAQQYYVKSMNSEDNAGTKTEKKKEKRETFSKGTPGTNTEKKKEKRKMYSKDDLPKNYIFTPPVEKGKLKIETPSGKLFRSIRAAMEYFQEQKKEENSDGDHKEGEDNHESDASEKEENYESDASEKEENYKSDASDTSNTHYDGLPTPYQLPKSQEEGSQNESEKIPAKKPPKKIEAKVSQEKKKEEKVPESDVEPNYVSDSDAESDFSAKNNYKFISQLNKEPKSSQRNIEHKKPSQHSSPKKKKIEDTPKKAETSKKEAETHNNDHAKNGDSPKKIQQNLSASPKKKNIFAELTIKDKNACVESPKKKRIFQDSEEELENDSDDHFQASPTKKRKLSTSVAENFNLSSRQELNTEAKETNLSFAGDADLNGESTGQDESQDDTADSNHIKSLSKKKKKKKEKKKKKSKKSNNSYIEGFM